jgi:hypothetical protein
MKFKNTLSENNLYGNIAVYSPDMDFMFYCNQRKLNFYIKNNLIKEIGEDKFQLTFKPSGLGHSDTDSLCGFGIKSKRENMCVVTGKTNNLTKHHIVPTFFRKHLPTKYKCSYLLVVLIEANEHRRYTIEEQKFYNVLAEKYGVEKWEIERNAQNRRPNNIAYALLSYASAIPEETQANLRVEFKELTGLEATEENLTEYNTKKAKKGSNDLFGAKLVAKITDFEEFEKIWLNHFIETTKPNFLPEDIILKYKPKQYNDYQTNF